MKTKWSKWNGRSSLKTLAIVGFSLALLVGVGSIPMNLQASKPGKIDPILFQKMKNPAEFSAQFPILVLLKDQADVSEARRISDRVGRISYVYDSLRHKAMETQSGVLNFLSERGFKEGSQVQKFYIANMIAVEDASKDLIQALAAREDVFKIYSNHLIAQSFPSPDFIESGFQEPKGPGENLTALGVDKVWNDLGVKGKGVVVAGQDTGYQWDHPALVGKYRGKSENGVDHNYNWHDAIKKPIGSGKAKNPCGYATQAPCDDNDHGTHTMGTMVGDDGQGNQIGMAPEAKWIGCRNMDEGVGRPSTYIECFEFFLAPYPMGGDPMRNGEPKAAPHVINNSWGCPTSEGCQSDEILPVLKSLRAAGIFVIVSAGNDGPGCTTIQDPPAWHSEVTLSVGAMNHKTGAIASFSSRGPSKRDGGVGPDVAAPGVNIRSSVPGGQYAGAMWSGTSMAGPHVVGMAALIMSAKPALMGKIDEMTALIQKSSKATVSTQACGGVNGNMIPNNVFGYGIIDPVKAVSTALSL